MGTKSATKPIPYSERNCSGKELLQEEKYWLADQHLVKGISQRVLQKTYSIDRKTISKYVEARKNNTPLHRKGGRPQDMDARDVERIREEMTGRPYDMIPFILLLMTACIQMTSTLREYQA